MTANVKANHIMISCFLSLIIYLLCHVYDLFITGQDVLVYVKVL